MPVGHSACSAGPQHASATRRLAGSRRRQRDLMVALAGERSPWQAAERLSAARAEVASRETWLHWIEQTATPEPWADGDWDTPRQRPADVSAGTWVMPAVPASVGEIRARVVAFARARGVPEPVVVDLQLAASEAITNVAMHAFRDRPAAGDVTATVELDEASGRLTLMVADDGVGMTPRRRDSPGLGLGLAIIARVTAATSVGPGPRDLGTRVSMTFETGRER
jgi:serine/threonine-protein kinase RsbW